MSRVNDVLGPCVARCRDADRMRAVRRRDARRDAACRLDRHGEIGAVHRAIDRRHRREIELPSALLGDRHADQSATELRHEVDRLGRNAIGRNDEIAFVLAILFVDENDDAPFAKVSDDVLDRCDRHRARNAAMRNRYVTGTACLTRAPIGRCSTFSIPDATEGRRTRNHAA